MDNIGKRIKDLWEANHLSQAELAKTCGSSQATIGKARIQYLYFSDHLHFL